MKNRILKILTVLVVIMTMTMTNFIIVGKGLVSYAQDVISTNHQNVEFEAYFKDGSGNKTSTIEREYNQKELSMYINVNVKKEGYFNGEISIENSNFVLKETNSEYVNKIEENKIYLNQINLGEIEVKIEPKQEEEFEIGLLNEESEVKLEGIYRDSTEKDKKVEASRKLSMKVEENNTEENVQNEMKVITNKIASIEGETKRIIQIEYKMGLKENKYPEKEINSKIEIPQIEGKEVEVKAKSYLNNMKEFE